MRPGRTRLGLTRFAEAPRRETDLTIAAGATTRLEDVESSVHVDTYEFASNIALRRQVTWAMVGLFFLINVSVVGLLFYLGVSDRHAMEAAVAASSANGELVDKLLKNRLITPAVLISLIGGTVTEVGTVMFLIATYLFPKRDVRKRPAKSAAGRHAAKGSPRQG